MRILSVDHGRRSGYSFLDGNKLKAIDEFITEGDTDGEKFCNFYRKVKELIIKYEPEILAIERPMDMLNGRTTKVLTGYYSMLHLLAFEHNLKVYEGYPSTIKKEVTGNGRADKSEVAIRLAELFNTSLEFITSNEKYKTGLRAGTIKIMFYDKSDSLAIAYTCKKNEGGNK